MAAVQLSLNGLQPLQSSNLIGSGSIPNLHHHTCADTLFPLWSTWFAECKNIPKEQDTLVLNSYTDSRGRSVLAARDFQENEIVCEFRAIGTATESALYEFSLVKEDTTDEDRLAQRDFIQNSLQLDVDLYALPTASLAFLANHSCQPNTYFFTNSVGMFLRALKPIAAGSEIQFDYSSMVYDSYTLTCLGRCKREDGSDGCRGAIVSPIVMSASAKAEFIATHKFSLPPPVQKLLNIELTDLPCIPFGDVKLWNWYHEGSDSIAKMCEKFSGSLDERFVRFILQDQVHGVNH